MASKQMVLFASVVSVFGIARVNPQLPMFDSHLYKNQTKQDLDLVVPPHSCNHTVVRMFFFERFTQPTRAGQAKAR